MEEMEENQEAPHAIVPKLEETILQRKNDRKDSKLTLNTRGGLNRLVSILKELNESRTPDDMEEIKRYLNVVKKMLKDEMVFASDKSVKDWKDVINGNKVAEEKEDVKQEGMLEKPKDGVTLAYYVQVQNQYYQLACKPRTTAGFDTFDQMLEEYIEKSQDKKTSSPQLRHLRRGLALVKMVYPFAISAQDNNDKFGVYQIALYQALNSDPYLKHPLLWNTFTEYGQKGVSNLKDLMGVLFWWTKGTAMRYAGDESNQLAKTGVARAGLGINYVDKWKSMYDLQEDDFKAWVDMTIPYIVKHLKVSLGLDPSKLGEITTIISSKVDSKTQQREETLLRSNLRKQQQTLPNEKETRNKDEKEKAELLSKLEKAELLRKLDRFMEFVEVYEQDDSYDVKKIVRELTKGLDRSTETPEQMRHSLETSQMKAKTDKVLGWLKLQFVQRIITGRKRKYVLLVWDQKLRQLDAINKQLPYDIRLVVQCLSKCFVALDPLPNLNWTDDLSKATERERELLLEYSITLDEEKWLNKILQLSQADGETSELAEFGALVAANLYSIDLDDFEEYISHMKSKVDELKNRAWTMVSEQVKTLVDNLQETEEGTVPTPTSAYNARLLVARTLLLQGNKDFTSQQLFEIHESTTQILGNLA